MTRTSLARGTRLWPGWVLTYGSVAAVSALSALRRLPAALYAAGSAVAVTAALVRARGIDWTGPILYNESNPAGNETGGLLVVGLWLAALAWSTAAASSALSDAAR